MDRQIVYTGQLPLTTDLLNSNLYAMIGLGRLARDILGDSTIATGLACMPTAPATMSVNIGAGALYSLQNVDNTAYSSLPANTTDQILKQGIVKTSDAASLTMAAPTTAGYSVIYVIQAAYQDVDGGYSILNYYNAANPSVPYTGPNNNSTTQPTVRSGKVSLQAKAGIAAASPVAPSVDAGYVALYYVTISYGQTSITSGNIAVAPNAPFLGQTLANCLSTTAAAALYAPLGAFANNLSAAGYQKLPGGLIFQWGTGSISGSGARSGTQSFNIAFSNGCLAPFAQDVGSGCYSYATTTFDATKMTILVPAGTIGTTTTPISTGTASYRWWAIGY